MKIAFYVYPTAFQSPGGGEILLLKSKEALEREGVMIKLFDPWHDRLTDFDILHTFGSVKESLPMMKMAQRQGIKNVLSTICWYNWKSAWGTYRSPKKRLGNLVRQFAKSYLSWLPSQRKEMMEIADVLLPNSVSEAEQLERYFGMRRAKIRIIPNAVDPIFMTGTPDLFINQYGISNFILCVGRIEPRKNQLAAVKALKNIRQPVVFIGDVVPGYEDYEKKCRKEASRNMTFLGGMEHGSEMLKSAYAACDTFLLPSWLETPGLAALEAALAGAKVVITREGATQEYFKGFVTYVEPDNLDLIKLETLNTFQRLKDDRLKNHVLHQYTWRLAALKTMAAYESVLEINPQSQEGPEMSAIPR